MVAYKYNSMVRGYHIYKDIWDAADGEVLGCTKEADNRSDPFAVAVVSYYRDSTEVIEPVI